MAAIELIKMINATPLAAYRFLLPFNKSDDINFFAYFFPV
jgi:hypothetical protein